MRVHRQGDTGPPIVGRTVRAVTPPGTWISRDRRWRVQVIPDLYRPYYEIRLWDTQYATAYTLAELARLVPLHELVEQA